MSTEELNEVSPAEAWYDAEIAPALLAIGAKLQERGLSMIATVEYAPGERGSTYALAADAGLAMRMAHILAETAPNVDSFLMNLVRYCRAAEIPMGASIALRQFGASA